MLQYRASSALTGLTIFFLNYSNAQLYRMIKNITVIAGLVIFGGMDKLPITRLDELYHAFFELSEILLDAIRTKKPPELRNPIFQKMEELSAEADLIANKKTA